MDKNTACSEFIDWFERSLVKRPGMFGSLAEISAMFFISDNVRNILETGDRVPAELTWNAFLLHQGLVKPTQALDESMGYERFFAVRSEYLEWYQSRRANTGK